MPDSHASDPLVGCLVAGRYRVLRLLGEGGMGQVYLAEHEVIEKKVALKVLRSEYSRKDDIVTRFQQEAISASRIKHPNVLDVFDFGKLESGEAFLAMEFLEGHDLSDDLAKTFVLDPSRGIQIALQICRALAAAHSKGVVHRDMKPDNVFLQRTGDGEELVKIVDFGIAQLRTNEEAAKSKPTRRRLTKTGMIFGTPEYMSPEQAAGRPADLRVDVYAVGVILYEMFTGSVPFTGDSFMAVLAKTLNDPPPPMIERNPDLRVSPELESVIMRSLAKSPDQRYASMPDFSNALVGTPEGAQFGRGGPGSMIGGRGSSYPEAIGAATAGQFGSGSGNPTTGAKTLAVAALTAPSAGGTAAIGTPTGVAGRTATPIDGQSSTFVPTRSASMGLVMASLGLVALLGVGGYVAFVRGSSPGAGPLSAEGHQAPQLTAALPPLPPAPSAPLPAVASGASGATETTVLPVTGAPSNAVRLHIVTDPPGAIISKQDFQVCEATPCDLTVTRNDRLELTARKGAMRGEVKLLPQSDQTLTIALATPAAKPKPAERLCEMDVGGLKILRPCK
jgi:tRNA A-37 threonylcarbamoyl transferase component Bud32